MDEKTLTLKKEIIGRGLKSLMDEAQVPMRQHLAVVQALQRRMEEHKKDILSHQRFLKEFDSILKNQKGTEEEHQKQIQAWNERVEAFMAQDWTGEQGEKGYAPVKGKDYFDGEPGKDADEDAIVSRILEVLPSLIPEPIKGEDGKVDHEIIVREVLTKMQKEQVIDLSHIKGAQTFIKDGVKYRFEELMHGGGGSKTGSGLSYLPVVTGAINNTNTVFTFSKTPTIVVVNGASYINGSGVTIAGTTATLDYPADTDGSVYALG